MQGEGSKKNRTRVKAVSAQFICQIVRDLDQMNLGERKQIQSEKCVCMCVCAFTVEKKGKPVNVCLQGAEIQSR